MMDTEPLHIGIDAFRLVGASTSIGTYTEELVEALVPLGYRITLYSPLDPEGYALERFEDGVTGVEVVSAGLPSFSPDSPFDCFKWNQKVLPNLMEAHPVRLLISTYHQVPCIRPACIPSIAVVHDLCGLRPDCGYRYFGRAWLRHYWNLLTSAIFSTRIIPISEMTRTDMLKKFPFCEARLAGPIYNRVSSSSMTRQEAAAHLAPYGIPETGFVLAFGIIGPRKNLRTAIDGYMHYRDGGGTLPLVLIGGKDEGMVRAMLPGELMASTIVLPRVSSCERDAFYRLATCLLFCSRCEGFGYPLVEAMRQGCPVIAAKETPASEITGGLVGLMERHDDFKECARLIHKYDELAPVQREALGHFLITRSTLFSGSDFGEAFDREIRRALEV